MKKTLKSVLIVICVAAMLLSVCSCGNKAPTKFVPITPGSDLTGSFVSGSSEELGKEALEKVVEVYNTLESEGSYKSKEYENAEWRAIVVSTSEGGQPVVHMISYLGDYTFAVKVDGASKGQYKVTSHELFTAFKGE